MMKKIWVFNGNRFSYKRFNQVLVLFNGNGRGLPHAFTEQGINLGSGVRRHSSINVGRMISHFLKTAKSWHLCECLCDIYNPGLCDSYKRFWLTLNHAATTLK